jgi:hypothetical protein
VSGPLQPPKALFPAISAKKNGPPVRRCPRCFIPSVHFETRSAAKAAETSFRSPYAFQNETRFPAFQTPKLPANKTKVFVF